MKKFVKFFLVWYSQQFAVPFWIVGHIHLTMYNYGELKEAAASLVMHLGVAIGFWIDWRQSNNK